MLSLVLYRETKSLVRDQVSRIVYWLRVFSFNLHIFDRITYCQFLLNLLAHLHDLPKCLMVGPKPWSHLSYISPLIHELFISNRLTTNPQHCRQWPSFKWPPWGLGHYKSIDPAQIFITNPPSSSLHRNEHGHGLLPESNNQNLSYTPLVH